MLRRTGLAGALATGALLAATGVDGLVGVDDRLEAVTPPAAQSIYDDGKSDRDCPKHRRDRDGV
jgi:hypothetical protein